MGTGGRDRVSAVGGAPYRVRRGPWPGPPDTIIIRGLWKGMAIVVCSLELAVAGRRSKWDTRTV